MGFWNKVKDALKPLPPAPRPAPAAPLMPPEEAYLRQLLEHVSSHPPAPTPATGEAPTSSLGRREFWAAIDGLVTSGRSRTATELLRRFAQARPEDLDLAARLVELLCDALDHPGAVPFLERLAACPDNAAQARTLRARFLLAEAVERAGDSETARAHYEAVLALDLDYPKARARVEKLRPAGGGPETRPVGDASPTIAGVEAMGTDVGARYRLVRELGRGASGAVYLARDQELERDVAVKLLHPHSSGKSRAAARARSFNEARIAAALRHPGVVAIYDLDEERSLIAMELCLGGTLRHLLGRGRLAPREALRRGVELLGTLAAVHRANIVHQDLKPGNLLFRNGAGDGDLVLADFGLAHLDAAAPTSSEAAAGTFGYMAPEQQRGEAGTAADIFAAGVILHEMLVGAAPDRAALLRGEDRFRGQLPDAAAIPLGPAAAPLITLLSSLMAPDPAARPAAAEARAALESVRGLATFPAPGR